MLTCVWFVIAVIKFNVVAVVGRVLKDPRGLVANAEAKPDAKE